MLTLKKLKQYENVCDAFIQYTGEDWSYNGYCHLLAHDTVMWLKENGFKAEKRWIYPAKGLWSLRTGMNSQNRGACPYWHFHCVVYFRREVHDLWFGRPASVKRYLWEMLPEQKVCWRRKGSAIDEVYVKNARGLTEPTTIKQLEEEKK